MGTTQDAETLARDHAYWRRVYDRLSIALAAIFGLGGAVAWSFTGFVEFFLVGLFLAAVSLAYLLDNHFNAYNPRRGPLETERLLEERSRRQQIDAITAATINGWTLTIASPVVFVVAIVTRPENGILIGTIGGLMFLVAGSLSIAWGRRSQRRIVAKRDAGIDRPWQN